MATNATEQTITTPEEAARRAFDALKRRDLSISREFWGPDSVDDFVAVGVFRGHDAILDYFQGMMAAFPDFDLDVEQIIGAERQAVVQWRVTGTFSGGPFLGIEPTGKRIDLRGVDVIDFDDEMRVKHNTIYYDGAEFARQIGMLPPRDSAADRAMTAAFNGATKVRRKIAERRG
jgi:steroid delta-isomerase-like uncharacterized protein